MLADHIDASPTSERLVRLIESCDREPANDNACRGGSALLGRLAHMSSALAFALGLAIASLAVALETALRSAG